MEHEVYVPFPSSAVRRALTEPDRVARCLPGAQLDTEAGTGPLEGRLRFRVGGSSITYRGTLTVGVAARSAQDADRPAPAEDADSGGSAGEGASGEAPEKAVAVVLAVEAHGTESRGEGRADVNLTVRVRTEGRGATVLACGGAVRSAGRLADFPHDAVEAAGRRLLDRFAENLAADLAEHAPPTEPGPWSRPADAAGADGPASGAPASGATPSDAPTSGEGGAAAEGRVVGEEPEAADARPDGESGAHPEGGGAGAANGRAEDAEEAEGAEEAEDADAEGAEEADAEHAEKMAEGLGDELAEDLAQDRMAGLSGGEEAGGGPGEPTAEAAHARRTMIGRSAEEVDHAPPRGRYAPVPGPETATGSATLRWAAPAAAVVLASAVVVGRALRRRR